MQKNAKLSKELGKAPIDMWELRHFLGINGGSPGTTHLPTTNAIHLLNPPTAFFSMDLGSKSHGHPAVATWWHAPSPRAATPVESKPLRCWGARDAAPNPPVSVPPGSWMRAPHDIPQESNISVANVSKANASNVNARPVFTLLHILTYMSTLIQSISCLAVGV